MDIVPGDSAEETRAAEVVGTAVYFDGTSNRRRAVTLYFSDRLEISAPLEPPVYWAYDDLRRADSPSGTLRLSCVTAPPLARLETRDAATAAELAGRCTRLDANAIGRRGIATIVGWSLAATLSLVLVSMFGVPLAADRLAPLMPERFERRIGEVGERQIEALFGDDYCGEDEAARSALSKLVTAVRDAAGVTTLRSAVMLNTPVPNALALPGGKVYLFNGLLSRAENPDEIAGILAHELGHLHHRDGTRNLIYNGGTSFLIGLLFGDVTGSGALIFASRSLVSSSYSREAEHSADAFAVETMHRLGRSTKAMGELMLRVTGKQVHNTLSILASHPLTEDRLAEMARQERPISGPPLLTDDEWRALKAICR